MAVKNFQKSRISQIIAFENGELDEEKTVELFQGLIDNGMAWKLQGSYGRTAMALIENGSCTPPGFNNRHED